MEIVIGIIAGALSSWLFTHIYYKRSLARTRVELRNEVLREKVTAFQHALASMTDRYLRSNGLDDLNLAKFVEINAAELLSLLDHHSGFVKEMLTQHRDEISFQSVQELHGSMMVLWHKYW